MLYLKEERLSYRSLEVEQIGSVYEAIMGYRVETATGCSVAIRPEKRHGAPVTIDLDALLAVAPTQRAKRFKALTDRNLPRATGAAVRDALAEAELVAALDRLIDRRLTPTPVPAGSLVFQPSPERRRTGSHYTPARSPKTLWIVPSSRFLNVSGPTQNQNRSLHSRSAIRPWARERS